MEILDTYQQWRERRLEVALPHDDAEARGWIQAAKVRFVASALLGSQTPDAVWLFAQQELGMRSDQAVACAALFAAAMAVTACAEMVEVNVTERIHARRQGMGY